MHARLSAPLASHGLYTQSGVLDDDVPAERDLGISRGMRYGIDHANANGHEIKYREILAKEPVR